MVCYWNILFTKILPLLMLLLFKEFVDKNVALTYGFIIEKFRAQKFPIYIWFDY